MKNVIYNLFKSKVTMISSVVIGCLAFVTYLFAYLYDGYIYISLMLVVSVFLSLSIIIVFISYVKHDKNVMKFSIGTLLTLVIVSWALVSSVVGYTTFNIFLLLFSFGIYFIHLLINADRHSSPALVTLNQICCALYFVLSIAFSIESCILLADYGLIFIIEFIAITVINLCAVMVVLFVETNLDAYRITRESKGWKE